MPNSNQKQSLNGINIHIYPSPFIFESRILKITQTLAEAHFFSHIRIFATWEQGLQEKETLDMDREVIRIKRNLGNNKTGNFWKTVKTIEWSWKIIINLKRTKVACINCHSLPMLPLCVFLKYIKRSILIYDIHELETETANSHGLRKQISKNN